MESDSLEKAFDGSRLHKNEMNIFSIILPSKKIDCCFVDDATTYDIVS